jgi:Nuclear pore component
MHIDEIANQFPLLTATSNAEYLVCTKAIDGDRINAILGFTLLQSPSGLLVLLASGQVLSLDLITDPTLIRGWPMASVNKMQLTVESPLGKVREDEQVSFLFRFPCSHFCCRFSRTRSNITSRTSLAAICRSPFSSWTKVRNRRPNSPLR